MPFEPACGQSAGAGPAATIRPGCGAEAIMAGMGAMSVSVFASVEAGVTGPTRMIAVTDRSSSKIMNARVASST
jgi:hypothetical protein